MMQHPSGKAAQSQLLRNPSGDEYIHCILALPSSFSKCNQFIQSSKVTFLWTSMSCPSEFLSETLQSSGEQDFSFKLCDMALKCSFPHHFRKSAQRGEPLQSPSLFICWWAWMKISKKTVYTFKPARRLWLASALQSPALNILCSLTLCDTT